MLTYCEPRVAPQSSGGRQAHAQLVGPDGGARTGKAERKGRHNEQCAKAWRCEASRMAGILDGLEGLELTRLESIRVFLSTR